MLIHFCTSRIGLVNFISRFLENLNFRMLYAGMNVLCGVGLLSTPYAVKEGGWSSLSLLFMFGILSFYTGILLRHCLDSQPGLETYPDIGQAAFGTTGRIVISVGSFNLQSLQKSAEIWWSTSFFPFLCDKYLAII